MKNRSGIGIRMLSSSPLSSLRRDHPFVSISVEAFSEGFATYAKFLASAIHRIDFYERDRLKQQRRCIGLNRGNAQTCTAVPKNYAAPTEYRELAPAIGAATPFGTARAIVLDAPRPTSPFGDQRESGNGSK
jgi:hypothetical protein